MASRFRHGCNECADACPYDVPISEVMRTRMYAHDYSVLRSRAANTAMLAGERGACLSCDANVRRKVPAWNRDRLLLAPTHQLLST